VELYCVTVIKHVASFTICAKSIPVYLWTLFTLLFLDVVVVSDLNKNVGVFDGFGEKKARICGFAYPYSPPL